jgi:hypothetical protein
MDTSAETEWPILLQHRKAPKLSGLAPSQQNWIHFCYALSPPKSRLIQLFETLSAISFQSRSKSNRRDTSGRDYDICPAASCFGGRTIVQVPSLPELQPPPQLRS